MRVGVVERQRHRLFDDDMQARRRRRHGVLGVHPARRQDAGDVRLDALRTSAPCRRTRARHIPRRRPGARAVDVADGGQTRAVNLAPAEQLGVTLGNAPTSNQNESQHLGTCPGQS